MKLKAAVLAVLCALALACDPLARTEMTLTFDDTGEMVDVNVVDDQNHLDTYHHDDRDRVGEDVLAGRDEWSRRFARAEPKDERLIMNRSDGRIKRMESQASIKVSDLQKFFSSDGVTVQTTRGEGWAELTMYPGQSARSTSREQATVKRKLDEYSLVAVDYFDSLRAMYAYLETHDPRAAEMFYAVYVGLYAGFGKEYEPAKLADEEKIITDRVVKSVQALMEATEKDNKDFSRLADLVYNPLPAVIDVKVPGEPLAVEGFERDEAGMLRASTATPDMALAKLEGRWIAPDLFAATDRISKTKGDSEPPRELAAAIAAEPRTYASVFRGSDIVDALVKAMQPAPRYRVRWATKTTAKER